MPEVRGLYAVTPDEADSARLCHLVQAALTGGARVVQYRNKSADGALRSEQARLLSDLCRRHAVPLIINDDLELALQLDDAGCHLGATDGSVVAARARLGKARILGVSCYQSLAAAHEADEAGADYVAFGSVFGSITKPAARRADLELFVRARAAGIRCALVGIGGIDAHNLAQLAAAGADAAAVIAALFASGDPREVERMAQRLSSLIPLVQRVP